MAPKCFFALVPRPSPSFASCLLCRMEVGLQPDMVSGMIREFPEILEIRTKRLKAVVKYLWKVRDNVSVWRETVFLL